VVIDIETGAFEIDEDELAASARLLARSPHAQVMDDSSRFPVCPMPWRAQSNARRIF
jgi:hypothetical protein